MPLARHDTKATKDKIDAIYVSTHMPLARHDAAIPEAASAPAFLLTCLLRGMTIASASWNSMPPVSTHMPLARHDLNPESQAYAIQVSTHMPLARHDKDMKEANTQHKVSTHMPLARHDSAYPRK